MDLSKYIQDKVDIELNKLRESLELEFNDTKQYWDRELASVKKTHNDEIDQEVNININFKKFQNSKTSKFNSGYAIQSQLEQIYTESLPEILASNFVKTLIQDTLQDIPQNTTLNITGQYSKNLETIISSFGYKSNLVENNASLGKITASLNHISLEITVEDILDAVKKKTLAYIIKEI